MASLKSPIFLLLFFSAIFFFSCKEEVCPDVCSESLKLKTGKGCHCECQNEAVFNQLMTKWGNLRICVQEFSTGEEPYILLSHFANYLTCGRSDYLLLYQDLDSEVPHPQIPNAKQGFFRINYYGEFVRDLWGYTKYEGNDTLYIGHGLNPSVSNSSFLCNEPAYHSGKLYYSNGMLKWDKKIYENAEDWEMENNANETHYLTFLLLKPAN